MLRDLLVPGLGRAIRHLLLRNDPRLLRRRRGKDFQRVRALLRERVRGAHLGNTGQVLRRGKHGLVGRRPQDFRSGRAAAVAVGRDKGQ